MLRGLEFVSKGRLENSYLLRISGALVMRSNSVIRVTRAETLQEIPQLIIVYEVYYNLPPGDSSENYSL